MPFDKPDSYYEGIPIRFLRDQPAGAKAGEEYEIDFLLRSYGKVILKQPCRSIAYAHEEGIEWEFVQPSDPKDILSISTVHDETEFWDRLNRDRDRD